MKKDITVAIQTFGTKIIENQITSVALAELLVEKGIITVEEFGGKLKTVAARDFETLREEISDLATEFDNQNAETE